MPLWVIGLGRQRLSWACPFVGTETFKEQKYMKNQHIITPHIIMHDINANFEWWHWTNIVVSFSTVLDITAVFINIVHKFTTLEGWLALEGAC
jgi:hypothetical protein